MSRLHKIYLLLQELWGAEGGRDAEGTRLVMVNPRPGGWPMQVQPARRHRPGTANQGVEVAHPRPRPRRSSNFSGEITDAWVHLAILFYLARTHTGLIIKLAAVCLIPWITKYVLIVPSGPWMMAGWMDGCSREEWSRLGHGADPVVSLSTCVARAFLACVASPCTTPAAPSTPCPVPTTPKMKMEM